MWQWTPFCMNWPLGLWRVGVRSLPPLPQLFFCFPLLQLKSTSFNIASASQTLCIGRSVLFYFIYLFIYYFWLCWVFVAARGLSLVAASGGYSLLRWAGFALWWLLLLRSVGSRAWGLQ